MRQIKKDARLPAKKRTMLGAILFIPAIIIFVLVFKQITNWRADIQFQQERAELAAFVNSVYAPLIDSQNAILAEKRRMSSLLQKVENLGLQHPNHAQLITDITQKWRLGLQKYNNSYKENDREIRRAWISYNTMDQQDVLTKFAKQSVRLDLKNKKAEKRYQNTIYNIQDKLIKSLDNARKLLNANRKTPKNRKQKALVQNIRQGILPFAIRVESKLIDFLGTIDQRLKQEVEKLQALIVTSAQQSILIRNHLQNNPDLEAPLVTTINNWIVLENDSREKLNQILYAVEAEYIALSLDLPLKSPAIRAMHKNLLKNIPWIVGKAIKQRQVIDQSYNISPRYRK
ncbi:MAG TPA: hypothetical protein EYH20_02245 [Leucothrix sp.]|nr:hypothetical protein [Leucothrix sp.]